jgi:hypothetical protein
MNRATWSVMPSDAFNARFPTAPSHLLCPKKRAIQTDHFWDGWPCPLQQASAKKRVREEMGLELLKDSQRGPGWTTLSNLVSMMIMRNDSSKHMCVRRSARSQVVV